MIHHECAPLQVDHHKAAQPEVAEEEINVEVVIFHFHMHLLAHEGEAGAELYQEFAEMFQARHRSMESCGSIALQML